MNNQLVAESLLRRLNLSSDVANVIINESSTPSALTVLVFSPEKNIETIQAWHGHPVSIIFTGSPPVPQIH